eukprot:1369559-Amorphochlora_amoeboformis.AAC.2
MPQDQLENCRFCAGSLKGAVYMYLDSAYCSNKCRLFHASGYRPATPGLMHGGSSKSVRQSLDMELTSTCQQCAIM